MSDHRDWHAHIYYTDVERDAASALRDTFAEWLRRSEGSRVCFVGRMTDTGVGPHPIPQYEIHFDRAALEDVVAAVEASGLTALIHPLTLDDLADHTTLARWIGTPLPLDLSVLDPPGVNQGIPRFGVSDF